MIRDSDRRTDTRAPTRNCTYRIQLNMSTHLFTHTLLTLSHCLSLLSRMMTSLGCIWYPSSLNDRLRPSNVTFIRYLQRETSRKKTLIQTCITSWKKHPSVTTHTQYFISPRFKGFMFICTAATVVIAMKSPRLLICKQMKTSIS